VGYGEHFAAYLELELAYLEASVCFALLGLLETLLFADPQQVQADLQFLVKEG